MSSLDMTWVRTQFPALQQRHTGRSPIFFDNPGGTQVPQRVADAMRDYLLYANANTHGAFRTSHLTDAVIAQAHQAAADLLGAATAQEIVFGQNMTTLTFTMSRALGQWLSPGDEIIVTHLDHDANITPWTMLARDKGLTVRWIDLHAEDCTLDLTTLGEVLTPRTKLVAVGYASNAVGTINPVQSIIEMAHSVGALVYVDAVQSVPHIPTDVQALGADFLACSAYKFFGPHAGMVYGRLDLLEALPAYKVRPAPSEPPHKFETGTQNHEGQAGTLAAIEYVASLADSEPAAWDLLSSLGQATERRSRLVRSMTALQAYERDLGARLIQGLQALPGVRIYGLTDPARLDKRVPTVSFTLNGFSPLQLAEALAAREIYVWNGNFYALSVTSRLNLEPTGLLRVGLAHYNTADEVDVFLNAVDEIRTSASAS
ncbi:MAG: cysteine desulfurase-like protein [Anaerolineae bacterium]|nr:cysteine desulfurase-like protein [Anaerolineae bacterium]